MRLKSKTYSAIIITILSISIIAWILLLFNPWHIMTIEHCHISDSGLSNTSLQMLLDMNPVSTQLMGWLLMVVAMMLPKLLIPIQNIYERSFKSRRLLSASLFVLGYIFVWTLVGIVIVILILAVHLIMPGSYFPATILGLIAIVWQFSPIKQKSLNRGHEHKILSAFGWAANRDAFLFGIMHGLWCVVSGWLLMLWPMLLPIGHNFAMIIVTFVMLSEHLEHPKAPRWHIDYRTRLLRIIIAQLQIRMKILRTDKSTSITKS